MLFLVVFAQEILLLTQCFICFGLSYVQYCYVQYLYYFWNEISEKSDEVSVPSSKNGNPRRVNHKRKKQGKGSIPT